MKLWIINKMDPKSSKVELSDTQLKDFCQKMNYKWPGVVYLDRVNTNMHCKFIYTGNEANEYNNGHTHHWLLLVDGMMFDSYGNYGNAFSTPDIDLKFFNKQRLQAFNSDVCGEYCLSMYSFYMQTGETNMVKYKNTYELGLNQDQNDKNILRWYKDSKAS